MKNLGAKLAEIGHAIQIHLSKGRDLSADAIALGNFGGDTVFGIDKRVEPVIQRCLNDWPTELKPLTVIAEGFGEDGRLEFGDCRNGARYRLMIDPIDGTRNIMYDKRSAWFLATIAPDRGDATRLSDSLASVMVELPTSKQVWVDTLVAERGEPTIVIRRLIDSTASKLIEASPSKATSLLNGFGQVSNFFPGTKELASELMERIAQRTLGSVKPGQASIFEDQYISTGGQLVELVMGHDRFCCDLRPIFYDILERRTGTKVSRGLECHPYDMAGLLVAQQAGVVVTDGYGMALDAPFDVGTGVHWCGYANAALRQSIEPVIQGWIKEKLSCMQSEA